MIALRRHYAGKGNSTWRIADSKRLQATLDYKTERALPSSNFGLAAKDVYYIRG